MRIHFVQNSTSANFINSWQWSMSENFQMNTCWLIRVFQMTTRRFHSNLWNGKQCLNNNLPSLMSTRSWQLLDDYFWGWPQLGQPKNRKALCEKNNGIPEAQEIGKKSFVRKTMVYYVLDCMHGLFYQTKLRKMSEALSWYFIFFLI